VTTFDVSRVAGGEDSILPWLDPMYNLMIKNIKYIAMRVEAIIPNPMMLISIWRVRSSFRSNFPPIAIVTHVEVRARSKS
jgi:hypothetical protein